MAMNYRTGHAWDALDERACTSAANEIDRLNAELQAARTLPAGMEPLCYLRPAAATTPARAWQAWENDGTAQPVYTAAQVLAMGRVPPGWQAVPVEPSAEMVEAGVEDLRLRGYKHALIVGTVEVWRAMLVAAPRPPAAQEVASGPCGQCKDARQPCQCSLDTILKERGLVAVNRESFQHMVTKIAAASAPDCWCAACDSAASPFGIPTRMSLCPKCGDKRCPRAQHHNSDCSAP
jgi:hypothetical protein